MDERLEDLEKQLDELQEAKYLLEQDFKKESHLRAEMQEFLGSIYHSCKMLLEDENSKLEASDLVKNLLQNIRDFAETYKIRL